MKQIRYYIPVVSALLIAACSAPRAHFKMEPAGGKAPLNISFSNLTNDADSVAWNMGDGTFSDLDNPEHRYLKSGRYTIVLQAFKGNKMSETSKEFVVEPPEHCLVEIRTPKGNMLVELYESTPLHRDNFLKLAEEGFYDGLLFHRVIDGFMIQGGDPDSRHAGKDQRLGTGGPGYQVPAEFDDAHIHIKGALAAARMGDAVNPEKKSSGSQFYIVQGRPVEGSTLEQLASRRGYAYTKDQVKAYAEMGGTPFLDGEYTVFGQVVEGLDIIDRIAAVKTGPGDRPEEDITMEVVVIK